MAHATDGALLCGGSRLRGLFGSVGVEVWWFRVVVGFFLVKQFINQNAQFRFLAKKLNNLIKHSTESN